MEQASNTPGSTAITEKSPLLINSSSQGKRFKGDLDPVQDNQSSKQQPKQENFTDTAPTWKDVMDTVQPYLTPEDIKHKLYAILALVSVLIGKLLNVLPPLAIKHAVDTISNARHINDDDDNNSTKQVVYAILTYFGLKVLIMLNGIVEDLAQRTVALDAERRFANKLFEHLHTLSLSYHLEKHIGEITTIMNRGSDSIGTVISSFLFYILPAFFEAVIVSAVFWKLVKMPSIAVITLASVALYLFFTVFVTRTRIVFRRKLIEASDNVGQKETETLVNYETVSMFGRTKYEIEQYCQLRQIYKDRRIEMLAMFALLQFGQSFIKVMGTCGGLLLAGLAATAVKYHSSSSSFMSPGTFVVVQMYIGQLFDPLVQLGWQYRMITQAFTDLEKAVVVLKRVPEVQDAPDARDWIPSGVAVSSSDSIGTSCRTTGGYRVMLKDVSFHYKILSHKRTLGMALNVSSSDSAGHVGKGHGSSLRFKGSNRHTSRRGRLAMGFVDEANAESNNDGLQHQEVVKLGGVDGINLCIPAGKTVALVGASGSGKTTLIRLILRMYDCDEGSVEIEGVNVKKLKQLSLREQIGVVAQDTILFNATLRENIVYGKENASEEEILKAVKLSALETFVSKIPNGLNTVVGERGMKLSGGERQRVGLARCIIKDPQLILLDEATSSLDSATEREIQNNIATLCRDRTTIMIAHRLSTARNADEIVVLDGGKVVERGCHEALLAIEGGYYAKMWNIQTGL